MGDFFCFFHGKSTDCGIKKVPCQQIQVVVEDFGMMMMMMVVVVMMIMTRVQIWAYTRILGDVPFNFCCTFADFLFVTMIFGNCRFW